jgi:tRNA(fMet)-specific endonuclease VapC
MLYMLDTNICIFLLGKKKAIYFDKLDNIQEKGHNIAISTIVLAELQFGVANSQRKEQNQKELNILLGKLQVMSYDDKCAYFYGELRTKLKQVGYLIGGNDLFIASHAMAEDAILITNNLQEFQRVNGLKIEHWENEKTI